jgi:hypothetical protein
MLAGAAFCLDEAKADVEALYMTWHATTPPQPLVAVA